MRHRLLLILHVLTIIMLGLTSGVGSIQTLKDYMRYGQSYQVTTIIEGVSVTETVDMSSKIAGLMFVAWLTMLLTVLLFVPNMPEKKEAAEARVSTLENSTPSTA